MAAFPITDSAVTLMNNVQNMAAVSSVNLQSIIYTLREMLDKLYTVSQTDFNAEIPDVDMAALPALIEEVEGYFDQILEDAETMKNGIANNAAAAIAKVEQIVAGMLPTEEPNTTLTVPTIDSAAGVLAANRAAAETERRQAELVVLADYAAKRFPLPPGSAISDIADIRLKMGAGLAKEASKVLQEQAEENVKLFIIQVEQTFRYTAELVKAWENLYTQVLAVIGGIIADYERSPLLDAEVQAKTAKALADGYSGLNRAAITLTNTAGTMYKAELAPHQLQAIEDSLNMDAYEAGMKLTLSSRSRIASALASALGGAGSAAAAAIGAVGANGSFTERAFS